MKKYFRFTGERDEAGQLERVQVGMDVVLGDAVLELVEQGIDEDTHHWGSTWRDLDDDDLEAALNNPAMHAKMFEYVRLPLIEKLREVLAARREETTRHSSG